MCNLLFSLRHMLVCVDSLFFLKEVLSDLNADGHKLKPLHKTFVSLQAKTENEAHVNICLFPTKSPAVSFCLALAVSQEFGQMEQTAPTSTPCAGHMTDPCWPLLMTLAKCTCSPSPRLNQGSVAFARSRSHARVHVSLLFRSTLLLAEKSDRGVYCEARLRLGVNGHQTNCFHTSSSDGSSLEL